MAVAAAEPLPGDPIMGLRSLETATSRPILDVGKLDRKVLVSNAESVAGVRALLEREGIFAGVSSGAVVHVARKLAEELDEGVVVCVLADGGWKYLSADFWDADDVEQAMEHATGGSPGRDPASARRARRAEAPNESCGLIAFRGEVAERYIPCVNTAESPYRFDLRVPDPRGPLEVEDERLRARRLPLAPDGLGPAVADGSREHRSLGGAGRT